MSWRYVSASATGTSHVQAGESCQDASFVAVASGADGAEWLIALAADGAGSARYGAIGARIMCETGGRFLCDRVEARGASALDVKLAAACVRHVRAEISLASTWQRAPARQFACTLVGAVIGPERALVFQIGDGAVVVRSPDRADGALRPVFWPDAGEYANTTYFVTDPDAAAHLNAEIIAAPDEVSLLTDGLQRLALVYATREAHTPFFEPMFAALRGVDPARCVQLNTDLARFLSSAAINARTDDDKTLVVATRRRRSLP
ncbi:PP2C family serine/threonine-protein phosphatase [Pararobbsia silviterrae]|uniref:Protein phosphatase 2C domain-containing protein n=1 Tax=Pararobbsia silviterrae TaxID=1792498 RepID=A0A494Y5H3_9BURK|nr:PP2C family serine/threonine-protein phosphatase [Pararobbsia silviterrae]RKP57523.1 protein phosphatase 2C domain-containing protein [Pararobbsia silviterrae]